MSSNFIWKTTTIPKTVSIDFWFKKYDNMTDNSTQTVTIGKNKDGFLIKLAIFKNYQFALASSGFKTFISNVSAILDSDMYINPGSETYIEETLRNKYSKTGSPLGNSGGRPVIVNFALRTDTHVIEVINTVKTGNVRFNGYIVYLSTQKTALSELSEEYIADLLTEREYKPWFMDELIEEKEKDLEL